MFGRDYQHRVTGHRQLGVVHGAQRQRKGARQGFRIARLLIDDALHTLTGKQRHRRAPGLNAALLRQRQPVGVFGLGEAETVLARVAQGCAVNLARSATADVANKQLQRPANGGVGAVALPQRIDAGIHADGAGGRAVDHNHRAAEHGGADQPVQAEFIGQRCFQRSQQYRHVFRLAAGQHRVDGDFFDRHRHQVRRHQPDHVVGLAAGALEHAQHPHRCRRHHRQAIAPTTLEAGFHRVFGAAHVDLARLQANITKGQFQFLGNPRLQRLRAATRAHHRQRLAQLSQAGQLSPVFLVPAVGALDFHAVLDPNQRRHKLDAKVEGVFERFVVQRGRQVGGILGRILRVDSQRPGLGNLGQQRLDQSTGRAVSLGDDDQAVGKCRFHGQPFEGLVSQLADRIGRLTPNSNHRPPSWMR